MKKLYLFGVYFYVLILSGMPLQADNISEFDFDWKFKLGDIPNAHLPGFNDSGWRTLDIPHDWSIEGSYHEKNNGTDWQSGYLPCGIGWYRKSFQYDSNWTSKEVKILFDGVYMNSSVWINGHFLGKRPNGYIGFEYNLTPYLKRGRNIISVQVDHSKPLSARWYTGSGIYRHVWLKVFNKTHIPTWGVHFTTPDVSDISALAEIKTTLVNNENTQSALELIYRLKDRNGKIVATTHATITINAKQTQEIIQSFKVNNPHLWSPDSPYLYLLENVLVKGGKESQTRKMKVGIRKVDYSVKGLFLNGKPLKIKGVCDHHTAGALGAAIPDQALERKLKLLKEMGCNAVRTAHNPFSPEFYTICDSIGLIVMNEAFDGWDKPKAKDDYGLYFREWWKRDLSDFIKRDRNHPSIIFWSIGNEVGKIDPDIQKNLTQLIRNLDPCRAVTQGGTDPTRGMEVDYDTNFRYLDMIGFNGNGEEIGEFEKFAQNMPTRFGLGTEVPHTYQTRGVYRTKTTWRRRDFPAPWELKSKIIWDDFKHRVFPINDLTEEEVFVEEAKNNYYQSSYDNASVRISARHSWQRSSSFPWLFGEFRWGSFDYLGESEWPQRCGNFGIIDLCGFPKDHYYLYQSLWSDKPMVHLLPHWTHPGKEGIKIPIVVYTNCSSVELLHNGKSLGEKLYTGEQLIWHVPYMPGEIKAVARTTKGTIVEKSIETAGKSYQISINTDKVKARPNKTDVVHLEVDITDQQGTLCPYAANKIDFDITGPARIIAVDNGDPIDHSPYKVAYRKVFRGKAILIIQTTGKSGIVTISARSKGLKSGGISLAIT